MKRMLWLYILHMLYVYSIFSCWPSKTMACESTLTTTSPCFSFRLSCPIRKAELWLKIHHCSITVAFTVNCSSVWTYQNLMLGVCYVMPEHRYLILQCLMEDPHFHALKNSREKVVDHHGNLPTATPEIVPL